MILTAKQEEGLKCAIKRYRNHEKYTVISGYAGTGKSTLIRFIIKALADYGVDEDDVIYTAYTGKACQVLANKGNANVSTLHKLLYDFFPRPDGTFAKKQKKDIDYHVVVVDEVSMAPKTLMDLLFSYDCYVICLGDPFQLPPPYSDENNHLLDHPDVFLDEVMRQAQESEIIRLTMDIRNHKPISNIRGEEVQIFNRGDLSDGMLQWADQILVGTNKTRILINRYVRHLQGASEPEPQDGDKLICLRNYWSLLSDDENALINGTIGILKNSHTQSRSLPRIYGAQSIDTTMGDLVTENGDTFYNLPMDTHMIMTGEKCVSKAIAYKVSKNRTTQNLIPYEFTYGYAITTHKAQGSQWSKVLVMEEEFPFDREEHARWLYTSVSRAEDKIVLLR